VNRLQYEKSPYLLQHAYNPVNWYPWGEEAFEEAKRQDKPVFLSIGYSTCHWCHVMEKESFEDDEVAQILNRDFIAIKVDREERPDIDAVYMAVCQALTGSGGWPLTILMTPEQKPFWAGTYLPKRARYGIIGLIDLLQRIAHLWKENRELLIKDSEKIIAYINRQKTARGISPERSLIHRAYKDFKASFDEEFGGFGSAPKFPTPHNLIFLLRYSQVEGKKTALNMAEKTLLQMYRGGIFDHLGGGFSRYSTDDMWLVPHFEKMLYDNALLTLAYLEAYRITQKALYLSVAERILGYVLRELRDEKGGFYCGQDADSDGVEGKFYVFTKEEIKSVLGEGADAFCEWYGVSDEGNFEGKNILNLLYNPRYESSNPEIERKREKLYEYRAKRTSLHKDDKILTSWNALMIAALSKASLITGKEEYLSAAVNAYEFIMVNLTDDGGKLKIRWRENESAFEGQLEDYAFFAFALLELYETTLNAEYLEKAAHFAEKMTELFMDEKNGGFYFYSKEGEQLISRPKETFDGAMPSGNSVTADVLFRLWKLTGEEKWQEISSRQFSFIAEAALNYPTGHSFALIALSRALYPSYDLVCVSSEEKAPAELREFLKDGCYPNLSCVLKTNENKELLSKIAPFTDSYPIPEKGSAYYLCENGACAAPVFSIEEVKRMLGSGQI